MAPYKKPKLHFLNVLLSKTLHKGAEEIAQWLTTFPEDSSSFPSPHMVAYHPL